MTKKFIGLLIVSIALLAGLFISSLNLGAADISLAESLSYIFNGESLAPWKQTILQEVRFPRSLLAIIVGASLACAGTVLQSLFRNPLASPSIIGVSSGASLGAIVAIFLGLAAINIWILPIFAFIGCTITLFLVYTLAVQNGQLPMGSLLLAGVAVGAFNTAMSALVLALSLQEWEVGKAIVFWTMGGLEGRAWPHVFLILPVFIFCFSVVFAFYRDLNILLIGETHALSVGVDVEKTRLFLLGATALLIATSISVAGGIAFIGLVVPHIARLLIGNEHKQLLPLATILGAITLLSADCLLRSNIEFHRVPLGVVTATIGAPFFLYLLYKQKNEIRL